MTIHSTPPSNNPYPSENDHRRQWRRIAREIAAGAGEITDDPASIKAPERTGELVVIGSGIEAAGFTSADELRIQDADKVFYCVADPATKVWINRVRPDAYDLYVLYDDAKPRYVTYMQMTEAMLHHVRQGQTVAAVFYGHPGIFVLSTHRAIKIARREGHRATMRPAVSALDVLCADLGVDPSQPGMAMYEASDMLIRQRRPDTGLHLVLWQVGLIGELGYRRQGYINAKFGILLDYLEDLYGPDQEVVNYVGSRYPGVEPQIDRQTIASLRDPDVQSRVTGISTFYLPPKTVAPSCPDMLERLGLIKPGQPLRTPDSPLRVIDKYSARERKAFSDFAEFDVPRTYQWQNESGASDFILALREDRTLREKYQRDPTGAVETFAGQLDARSRKLLARRDPGAMQVAAKEIKRAPSRVNRAFFFHLLARKAETAALHSAMDAAPEARIGLASDFAEAMGFTLDWPGLNEDWEIFLRQELTPWGGFYLGRALQTSVAIHARPGGQSDRILLNGRRLNDVRFVKGVLRWDAGPENSTSGQLQADRMPDGTRRLVGLIWDMDESPASGQRIVAYETQLKPALPASAFAGSYGETVLSPYFGVDGADMRLRTGDAWHDAPVQATGRMLHAGDRKVPLDARESDNLDHASGTYAMRIVSGTGARVHDFRFTASGATLDGYPLTCEIRDSALFWTGGPTGAATGELRFTLDPVTLCPQAYGTAKNATGVTIHLRGMRPPDPSEQDSLAAAPRLGLPDWAWKQLLRMQLDTAQKGGLFIWQGWDRAAVNQRRIDRVLELLREDIPL